MSRKSQQGIALIWIILVGTLLVAGVEVILLARIKKQAQDKIKTQVEVLPAPSPEAVSKQEEPSLAPTISLPPDFLNWLNSGKKQEPLLKILPPKERAELESAIRETQQVLQNIEVFNYSPPSIGDITKGLDQINKQSQEQIQKNIEKQQQEFQQKYQQEIDLKKIEEYFRQNPPAAPHSPAENQNLSPQEQEYYYRKYILKDPAFQ